MSAMAAKQGLVVTRLATFEEPWAMALLPDGALLVTEKAGSLKLRHADGRIENVARLAVDYGGQGGLGDVVLAPDFATSRVIWLSWAEAGSGDTRGAAVGWAHLAQGEKTELHGPKVVWRQDPKVTGRGHYSHRIAFSPDGKHLYIASGDRQKMDPAQDLNGNLGKIVRLALDGKPASDNPFAAKGGSAAQVWSLGHRNVLGLAFDGQGRLWDVEHGPQGGDELNLVKPGQNYGWPLVSHGDHYSGKAIPRPATRPDLADAAVHWNPVIGPGGMIFYSGKMWPEWKGQALIAGMVSQGLVRVAITGESASEAARIPMGTRIRAVAEAADGSLLVLEDGKPGRLLRIAKAN